MSIKTVLQKAPVIIFKVLKSLVQVVEYQKKVDDGFGTATVTKYHPEMIVTSTAGISPTSVSFYSKMQSNDKIGMIKGVSVVGYEIANDDRVVDKDGNLLEVKEFDVDAAGALYVLLLRGIA